MASLNISELQSRGRQSVDIEGIAPLSGEIMRAIIKDHQRDLRSKFSGKRVSLTPKSIVLTGSCSEPPTNRDLCMSVDLGTSIVIPGGDSVLSMHMPSANQSNMSIAGKSMTSPIMTSVMSQPSSRLTETQRNVRESEQLRENIARRELNTCFDDTSICHPDYLIGTSPISGREKSQQRVQCLKQLETLLDSKEWDTDAAMKLLALATEE